MSNSIANHDKEVARTPEADINFAVAIASSPQKHPALNRIHQKLKEIKGLGAEVSITAYDRMHHRHNRS